MPICFIGPAILFQKPGDYADILRAAGFELRYPPAPNFPLSFDQLAACLDGVEAAIAFGDVVEGDVHFGFCKRTRTRFTYTYSYSYTTTFRWRAGASTSTWYVYVTRVRGTGHTLPEAGLSGKFAARNEQIPGDRGRSPIGARAFVARGRHRTIERSLNRTNERISVARRRVCR